MDGNIQNIEIDYLCFINKGAMDEKIKNELDAYGLSIEDLTKDELEELKSEIKAKEDGQTVLDGVLFSIAPLYGKRKKSTL